MIRRAHFRTSERLADLTQADILRVQAVLAAGAPPTAALREVDHRLTRDAVGALDGGLSLSGWLRTCPAEDLEPVPAAAGLLRALSVTETLGAAAGPAVDAVLAGIAATDRARRITRVKSTQATQSARFLVGLPLLAGLGLSVADRAVARFWLSGLGAVTAVLAAGLIGGALLWTRRLVATVRDAPATVDPLVEDASGTARLGAAATVGLVGMVLGGIVVGVAGTAAVWIAGPLVRATLHADPPEVPTPLRRDQARDLPTVEAIELLALALSSSAPLPLACAVVATACAGPTGDTFGRIAVGLDLGEPPDEAFPDALADVAALLDVTLRWGAPSAQALRVLAADLRVRAASAAEEAAEQLAVRLVFPTTLLLVPAFGLLVVAPLAVSMLSGLQLGG